MKLPLVTAFVLVAASSAFAQMDASTLRAKYGAPLDRETFTVRPGIEMIVDYGPNKHVCLIRLPSGEDYGGTIPDDAITKQRIDQVLDEVVPFSMRGKEVYRMLTATGGPTVTIVIYEHVTIREMKVGSEGKGITVTFRDLECPSGSYH